MGNESFEFLLGKPKMPKGHGTMGVAVSETAAMKDTELVTFPVSFPLLFFTILDSGRQNY